MAKELFRQIGRRVRSYRKLVRLTQEQLAEKADLSAHFLSFIESGKARPTLESLERIASALGVQIGDLFQFPKGEAQETKELVQQITRLLKRRRPEEIRIFRNLVLQIVELLPPIRRA